MDATALRAMQAPLKERYKGDPKSAYITLKAKGTLDDAHIACKVETGRALAVAGLHPATGGSGLELCSGDMLLEALVACAGVTLKAVATAIDVPLKSGKVSAEGDLDFRGTLGVAKDAPVGFAQIRLQLRGRYRRTAGQARPAPQAHRALLRRLPDDQERPARRGEAQPLLNVARSLLLVRARPQDGDDRDHRGHGIGRRRAHRPVRRGADCRAADLGGCGLYHPGAGASARLHRHGRGRQPGGKCRGRDFRARLCRVGAAPGRRAQHRRRHVGMVVCGRAVAAGRLDARKRALAQCCCLFIHYSALDPLSQRGAAARTAEAHALRHSAARRGGGAGRRRGDDCEPLDRLGCLRDVRSLSNRDGKLRRDHASASRRQGGRRGVLPMRSRCSSASASASLASTSSPSRSACGGPTPPASRSRCPGAACSGWCGGRSFDRFEFWAVSALGHLSIERLPSRITLAHFCVSPLM